MKYQYSLVAALLLPVALLAAPASRADTVNQSNITEFDNGQPALADEVNGNFSAIKTAVDDNANTLAAHLAAGIQLADDKVDIGIA